MINKFILITSSILLLLSPSKTAKQVVYDLEADYGKERYGVRGVKIQEIPNLKTYMDEFAEEMYKEVNANGSLLLDGIRWVGLQDRIFILPNWVYDIQKFKVMKNIRDIFEQQLKDEINSWGNNISDLEKLERINKFVYNRMTYDYNTLNNGTVGSISNVSKTGFHKAKSWTGAYEAKTSVCAGYTALFNKMAQLANVNTVTVQNKDHAWVASYIDGKWKYFDPTWNQTLEKEKAYFNLTYEEMLKRDKELQIINSDAHILKESEKPKEIPENTKVEFKQPAELGKRP